MNHKSNPEEENPIAAIKDRVQGHPITKIIFWGAVAIGGIYLFGLTSKVIANAVKSYNELQDALKKK